MQEYDFPESLKLYVFLEENGSLLLKFLKGTYVFHDEIGHTNQYKRTLVGIYVYDSKLECYITEKKYKEQSHEELKRKKKIIKRKRQVRAVLDRVFPGGK